MVCTLQVTICDEKRTICPCIVTILQIDINVNNNILGGEKVSNFKSYIRAQRRELMPSAIETLHKTFIKLDYHNKNKEYFYNHASDIVRALRRENYTTFLEEEKEFSIKVYESLIDDDTLAEYNNKNAVKNYIRENVDNFYALSLSNTQSRRSRAGSEFEGIIELLLMGAEIPFDTQGAIGSGVFETKELAKLVDCVSPGVEEYTENKRNTLLISAKTTLRERWQEVGDEMSRTKAREMYLATVDTTISQNKINLIGKNNIMLVTYKDEKESKYNNSPYVISFETMLEELETNKITWDSSPLSSELTTQKVQRLKHLQKINSDKPFISGYFKKMASFYTND